MSLRGTVAARGDGISEASSAWLGWAQGPFQRNNDKHTQRHGEDRPARCGGGEGGGEGD